MAPLLSITQATKRYIDGRRDVLVLDGISLEVDHGDFVGVWGPKRSGKSTLLRMMAGLVNPESGEVSFDGRSFESLSARERARLLRQGGIALVSSEWSTQIVRPVVELVAMACASDGTHMPEARARARKALSRAGVVECADVRTDQLTLGERMHVGLAMALVREPRLLLIDEPAVLPSPLECDDLYALLRSLGDEPQLAMVIASENLAAFIGTRRMMSISGDTVRSMDQDGVIVPFPDPSVSRASRVNDARS